jgi:sortase A
MRKLIAFIIILAGLGIILFPGLKSLYVTDQQDDLLSSFEETMKVLSDQNDKVVEEITLVLDLTTSEVVVDTTAAEDEVESSVDEIPNFDPKVKEKPRVYTRSERNAYITSAWPVEAILEIESIDLIMPVIEGTKPEYLDVSVCSLLGTSKPWESGNYAIAGHRSLTYGRHFNRLNELMFGEIITIRDLNDNLYIYEIYSIEIVHQSDVSVLENKDFDEITLITCDPIGEINPEYRIVVKGKKN